MFHHLIQAYKTLDNSTYREIYNYTFIRVHHVASYTGSAVNS